MKSHLTIRARNLFEGLHDDRIAYEASLTVSLAGAGCKLGGTRPFGHKGSFGESIMGVRHS